MHYKTKLLILFLSVFFLVSCGVKGPPKPKPSKDSSGYVYDEDYLSTTKRSPKNKKK